MIGASVAGTVRWGKLVEGTFVGESSFREPFVAGTFVAGPFVE